MQIENMDALFEAQFSPLADSGRALSKCGKCLRYMKYISTQPSRLYCNMCEEVYHLPQKGTIKVLFFFCLATKFSDLFGREQSREHLLLSVILFLWLNSW